MIYSAACSYAIRAVTRLAMLQPSGYLLMEELCKGTDLPRPFVARIFQDLVRKKLLKSAKGRGGGFAFARSPGRTKLYEIVAAVDGVEQFDRCVVGLPECDDTQPCAQHEHWAPIRDAIQEYARSTTVAQMAKSLQAKLDAGAKDG